MHRTIRLLLLFLFATTPALAQGGRGQGPPPERAIMGIEEYDPRSTLRVPGTVVTRAKFPFIDVHGHQGGVRGEIQMNQLVHEMDGLNLAVMVNLSGGSGTRLIENRESLQRGAWRNRFVVFANLDFQGIDDEDWGARAAAQLERDVRQGGAVGLKIFKNLGMDLIDGDSLRIPTDDPRFDPVWQKAGELGIPVLIHTGEPVAFFDPIDRYNERWLELTQFPGRARPAGRYPSFEEVMTEQHNVFRNHPNTTFINAHLGWLGNDLARLGRLLDELPNMYVELGAVIHEIGRQPRFAREFFTKYQDRIMMGKDAWGAEEYHTYFRVFETEDEYFPY
jgi:predicted TIM-barrel fold metal-dependent hydrolase